MQTAISELDQLPVDQRAALSLLLGRGMSYAAVAGLLALDAEAVRTRALAALDGLAPIDDGQLRRERRGEIGDYLMSQQPASQRALTRNYLTTSPAARGWARIVAARLAPLAADLPEIPPEGREVSGGDAAGAAGAADRDAVLISRRNGMFALAGLGVVVAVVIVALLTSSGSTGSTPTAPALTTATTTLPTQTVQTTTAVTSTANSTSASTSGTTGATGPTGPQLIATAILTPPDGKGHMTATAYVLQTGTKRMLTLSAQGLPVPHGFRYAVWLYNSEAKALPLGFIVQQVAADGSTQAVGTLPPNVAYYRELVLTMERTDRPTQPGPIVLAGPLMLPPAQ